MNEHISLAVDMVGISSRAVFLDNTLKLACCYLSRIDAIPCLSFHCPSGASP